MINELKLAPLAVAPTAGRDFLISRMLYILKRQCHKKIRPLGAASGLLQSSGTGLFPGVHSKAAYTIYMWAGMDA